MSIDVGADVTADVTADVVTADVVTEPVADDARRAARLVATDLAVAAAAGDRAATRRLMAVVRPAVLRYCRARLGAGATATAVAHKICATFASTMADLPGRELSAFVHRIAVAAVDEVVPTAALPGMSGMLPLLSGMQREVLVLRVAIGLSAEETAATLGCTPAAVRRIQHEALGRLRTAR